MQIIRGKLNVAQKVVVYGPEGIGKSSFAACFPAPIFIDTEGSTKHLDVARTPRPSSFSLLVEQVRYFINHTSELQTLVLDTADWAEQLCITSICAKAQKSSIEEFGYGKGYTYLYEEFGKLLNLLEELIERGINVVVTAHAKMRKFEQPDEMGAYDRWELKLQKTTAPLLKEWADMVLFANYETMTVKRDDGKVKAQGGAKRVMFTTHHACWDAKNRHGLADKLSFSFDSIAHCIPSKEPQIEKDGGGFVLLPKGDYTFTVTSFERGNYDGGPKIPACKKATLAEQIAMLKEERQNLAHKDSLQSEWMKRFRQYGQIDTLTRSLVTELVERIDVHEGRMITIHFKFEDGFEKVKAFAEQEMQALQAVS